MLSEIRNNIKQMQLDKNSLKSFAQTLANQKKENEARFTKI